MGARGRAQHVSCYASLRGHAMPAARVKRGAGRRSEYARLRSHFGTHLVEALKAMHSTRSHELEVLLCVLTLVYYTVMVCQADDEARLPVARQLLCHAS